MKAMIALVLVLALCGPAFAGPKDGSILPKIQTPIVGYDDLTPLYPGRTLQVPKCHWEMFTLELKGTGNINDELRLIDFEYE